MIRLQLLRSPLCAAESRTLPKARPSPMREATLLPLQASISRSGEAVGVPRASFADHRTQHAWQGAGGSAIGHARAHEAPVNRGCLSPSLDASRGHGGGGAPLTRYSGLAESGAPAGGGWQAGQSQVPCMMVGSGDPDRRIASLLHICRTMVGMVGIAPASQGNSLEPSEGPHLCESPSFGESPSLNAQSAHRSKPCPASPRQGPALT